MKTSQHNNQTSSFNTKVSIATLFMLVASLFLSPHAFGKGANGHDLRAASDITYEETLSDTNGMPFDSYGGAVSVSGNWAMVGAESNSDLANSAGAVFVFQNIDGMWTEVDEINASDPGNFELFGVSVSMSGDTAMIGAWGDDGNKGAVYVFERTGSQWTEVDKLVASDATAGDQFGNAISLHGNRLIVGSPRDDDNAFNSGTAYVFEYNGNNWIETGKLTPDGSVFEEFFGSSVSLDGDRVLIGAYNSTYISSTARSGSAYVFEHNGVSWGQVGKFYASDGAANDLFGFSVSIAGDHALVGAHGDDINTGAVYAYSFDGVSWGDEVKLNSADAEIEDAFGLSIDLNGDRALIGAYRADNSGGADSGAGYVFEYDGQDWNEMTKLFNNSGVNNDFLGRAVAQTNSWLFIGASGANGNRGQVRVYLDDPVYLDGFNASPGKDSN